MNRQEFGRVQTKVQIGEGEWISVHVDTCNITSSADFKKPAGLH